MKSPVAVSVLRPSPLVLRFLLVVLAVALVCLVGGMAHATAASSIDTSLNPAATQICKNLDSVAKSAFVSVIALVMFVGGLLMVWLKQRGGLALAAFGLVGFFVVKQLVPIAKSMGIVPAGITC